MGGGMMKMMKGGMMNNLLTNPSLKDSDGKWRHSMMGNFGLFGFGWIFMILFWVLVILVIVWLVKTLAGKTSGQAKNLTAQEILKQRYAKGEISKKEFEQMKKDIS
jgi:putative membrane protein